MQSSGEPEQPRARKPYQAPQVTSHRVFEASLACLKIPSNPSCRAHGGIAHTRS